MFSLKRFLKRFAKKIARRTVRIAVLGDDKNVNGYIKKRKILSNDKFEHREIAEIILGRKLEDWEEVHHIDFVRDNNHPSNLCVMSKSDHRHYHNWHRWMEKNKPDTELTIEYRRNKLNRTWECTILG